MQRIETRIADLWFEDDELLKRIEPMRTALWEATVESGATIITEQAIQFSPHGVTILLGLAESHVLIQSWVEKNLLTVDVTTCGNARIDELVCGLVKKLNPVRHSIQKITRGKQEV